MGLEKDRPSLAVPLKWPDCGYGLFFTADFFDLAGAVLWFFLLDALGEASAVALEDLRFARRFIHPVKGRLRVCRSFAMKVSRMRILS